MWWILLALVNILLAFFAEYSYQESKLQTWSFLGAIVLFNTIFIGFRDFGVGVDTVVYIEDYFNFASSIVDIDAFFSDESHDKGFVLLAIIANYLSDSKQGLLVITELFITFFIVLGVFEYKKTVKLSFVGFFTLFWLLYQQETINLMRQFCAMSLLFYGFAKLIQRKYILFIFIQVISYFFHSTSLLFLIVPFGYIISKSKSKLKFLVLVLPVVGAFYVYGHFYDLLYYASDMNIIGEVYAERYGEQSIYDGSNGRVNFKLLIPAIMVVIVYYYKLLSETSFYMLLFLLLSTFFLEQAKFISQYFFRMSYYPGLVFLVYFSVLFKYKYWEKLLFIQFICILFFFRTACLNYTFMESPTVGFEYRSKIFNI